MDQLQKDLDADHPETAIQIIGINQTGHEEGNTGMAEGRDLPLLQDVDADNNEFSDLWLEAEDWDVTFRDVIILNAANEYVARYNLTEHNIKPDDDPTNYNTLKSLLLEAAEPVTASWQNSLNIHDVDGDGVVLPFDVLLVINRLNEQGIHEFAARTNDDDPYYDVSGDGMLTPQDALLVINFLNDQAAAEGEGEATSSIYLDVEKRDPAPIEEPFTRAVDSIFAQDLLAIL